MKLIANQLPPFDTLNPKTNIAVLADITRRLG
jgi:hypothetical protein